MTAGLTPERRKREDVRYRLAVKRLYVRAAILDFFDSQPQPHYFYRLEDEPGITNFYSGSDLGWLGWVRIYEVGDNACVILFHPDPGVTNKEAAAILRRGRMRFAPEDAEVGQALLFITTNISPDIPDYYDDICADSYFPELSLERLNLARALLQKYRQRIIAGQKHAFQRLERAIIAELRLHGFWPEEPGAALPGPLASRPVEIGSKKKLSGVKPKRGRKFRVEDEQERVRIVREWLKVADSLTQQEFCLNKNFSIATLQRYIRYVNENGLLDDAAPS